MNSCSGVREKEVEKGVMDGDGVLVRGRERSMKGGGKR